MTKHLKSSKYFSCFCASGKLLHLEFDWRQRRRVDAVATTNTSRRSHSLRSQVSVQSRWLVSTHLTAVHFYWWRQVTFEYITGCWQRLLLTTQCDYGTRQTTLYTRSLPTPNSVGFTTALSVATPDTYSQVTFSFLDLFKWLAYMPCYCLDFAASTDNIARLWNVETGEVKREYTGHTKAVSCLAFNDQGLKETWTVLRSIVVHRVIVTTLCRCLPR